MSLFKKPTVYTSHAILGETGDMKGNCERAIKYVQKLRRLFPEINWHLPAESDIIIQILYRANRLSIDNILWADLEILKECDGHLWLKWEKSKGCLKEFTQAYKLGLPQLIIVDNLSKINYTKLRKRCSSFVESIIKKKG